MLCDCKQSIEELFAKWKQTFGRDKLVAVLLLATVTPPSIAGMILYVVMIIASIALVASAP